MRSYLLCFGVLAELNEKICVLVDYQSVIWEATDSLVKQSDGLLKLQFIYVRLRLAYQLQVG